MDPQVIGAVIVAFVMVCILTACSTTTGSLCPAGPIVLDRSDQLSRSTAEQIVTLNEAGERICGWRAP